MNEHRPPQLRNDFSITFLTKDHTVLYKVGSPHLLKSYPHK